MSPIGFTLVIKHTQPLDIHACVRSRSPKHMQARHFIFHRYCEFHVFEETECLSNIRSTECVRNVRMHALPVHLCVTCAGITCLQQRDSE